MDTVVAWSVLALSGATLIPLIGLGLHRLHLLRASARHQHDQRSWSGPLPKVTVQLPVYNERNVVGRLIDAVADLDYPRDLLQIQILDDSSDETRRIARTRVAHWASRGIRVDHIEREARSGFKAGALAEGLRQADGEFILILDADFVPPADLVRRMLGPFRQPRVGMVQARWGYLNEGQSLLTRCQALMLDAHFLLEHGGRAASDRFFNFNGTAGMWRRRAIEEAGGWSADTLTEDLDLSYRAQASGWRFVFLPGVVVPSELPDTVPALETQQRRWTQGGIQTARKVLPGLLRAKWRTDVKIEAAVHLLGHLAHPLTVLLGLLILPSALARVHLGLEWLLPIDLVVLFLASGSFLMYFLAAGRRRGHAWPSLVHTAVPTMALGIGLGPTLSRAVFRGATEGNREPFRRTPKRGGGSFRYRVSGMPGDTFAKGIVTAWMLTCIGIALYAELYASLPLLVLFAAGYLWVFLAGLPTEAVSRPSGGAEVQSRTESLGPARASRPCETIGRRAAGVTAVGLAVAALLTAALPARPARAQWVETPGSGWIDVTLYRLDTRETFDLDGQRRDFFADGHAVSTSLFVTAATGLLPGVDAWVQLPYHRLRYDDALDDRLRTGVGDTSLYLRVAPLSYLGSDTPLALRAGAKVAMGDFDVDAETIPLGDGQTDIEAILEVGRSFYPRSTYVSGWAGYRWRTRNAAAHRDFGDEAFFLLQAGGAISPFTGQLILEGMRSVTTPVFEGVRLANAERSMLQLTPKIALEIPGGSLSAGARVPLSGKNLPAGISLVLGYFTRWGN